jgi:hypothetical protein
LGCTKKETIEFTKPSGTNIITPLSNEKGMMYRGSFNVGHSSGSCSGCVTLGGVCFHVDCQGGGNYCSLSAAFKLIASNRNDYYCVILNPDELTHEDFFLMPDRSLYVEGTQGRFLNIPEQLVYRDDETGTFTFYDVFFSDHQMFGNK